MASKVHVLAFPFPTPAHINPMIQLSYKLASLGLNVTFVSPIDTHSFLIQSLPTTEIPINFISLPNSSNGLYETNLQLLLRSTDKMEHDFEKLLGDLVRDIGSSGGKLQCLICDVFMGWTQAVSKRLGIPRAGLWVPSATWSSISFQLPLLIEGGFIPKKCNDSEKLISVIPGVPPFKQMDLPNTIIIEDPYDPGYANRIHRGKCIKEDCWTFVNTFHDLESNTIAAMQKEVHNYIPIGPLLELAKDAPKGKRIGPWKEDTSCLEWLDAQRLCSVVYVSFGCLATLNMVEFQELALGLESSLQPFLLVMRPNLVSDISVEFMEEFKDRIKERGIIVNWAPQLDVLSHPSVGSHLSHCGWNSLLESISSGVPILGWPCVAEQKLNCWYVVEHYGLGMQFHKGKDGISKKEEVEKVILKMMLEEEGMKARSKIKKLQQDCISACDDSAYTNLRLFVDDITSWV